MAPTQSSNLPYACVSGQSASPRFPRKYRLRHWFGASAALALLALLAVVATYVTVPTTNSQLTHFDTLIVLGSPADPDGRPSSEQRERVMQAVREFRAGRAANIIVSGGAAHSMETEARVMAAIASEAGIPPGDLIEEPQARNTIQNVYYSERIMESRGWTSAEVVSSPSHLPRTGLILGHWPLRWRVQPSPWPPEYNRRRIAAYYVHEALGTAALRWFGFRHSSYLPGS